MSSGILDCDSTAGGNAQQGQIWGYHPLGPHTEWLRLIFESSGVEVLADRC